MRAPALSLVLGLACGSAQALMPEGSPAVLLAIEAGEAIGAAGACGATQAETDAAGRRVEARVRALATKEPEAARARQRYEAAVSRGAARQAGTDPAACPANRDRLRALLDGP